MRTNQTTPQNIDEYIAGFPDDVQEILQKIRTTIHQAAPGAEEKISYQMPTFTLKGDYLIYFAGYKKHVGLYPAPIGEAEFKEELSAYASGKGTVKFPLDQPMPFGLISKIVKYRMKKVMEKAASKRREK
ncbi:MAG: DUF1801 domain-containing protein [candidate division KSB1 bacterium]|nr:DUF1801 domain-containing protein [candidate division KSB1 bacterium]